MSQNDFVVANANGATVRADINSALQALASLSGGGSAPATTYANQWWFDTANDILKIRDEANANWVEAFSLVGTTWVPYSNGAVLGTAANLNYASVTQNLTLNAKHIATALTTVSSGTPDFATSGNVVSLSGTATANTLGTVQAGFVGVIHYGLAITLTHNATSRILNNNGSNILTAAGDVEVVLSLGSGNWRTVSYTRGNGLPVASGSPAAKTGNYTVVDADRGAVLRFAGLSAGATVTLPAASGRGGFEITIRNDDSSDYVVIIDPNASEQLDGQSTISMYSGSAVTIMCDGTGWRTKVGNYRYCSGAQVITSAGSLTLAHGLGRIPRKVWCELECTSGQAGYSIGDVLVVGSIDADGTRAGVSLVPDATNINVRFGSAANVFAVPNKSTGTSASLTNSSWDYRVYAEI